MTRRIRTDEEWMDIFDDQTKSGLNVISYCKKHHISDKTFYGKRKSLMHSNKDNKLIPVIVKEPANKSPLSFSFNGIHLSFDADSTDEQIKRVLKVCHSL